MRRVADLPGGAEEARSRIDVDGELNAFVSLTDERGEGPALAVKDNIDVRGTVTTGATGIEPGAPAAERDAWAVTRMREAGYVVVGKTNMHEHGLGSTNHNPHFGTTRNPHDRSRISGGSSGGSAAAVAAGLADLALGTDTGGSIRIPSALCGVVGIRPTFGAIPMDGITPLAHTQDVVGPIGPDVRAVARALAQLGASTDPCSDGPTAAQGFRLGTPAGWVSSLDTDVASAWGAIEPELEPVDVDRLEAFVEPGLVTLYAESATNHGVQLRDRPETLGADVRKLLEDGTRISATAYIHAQRERARLGARIDTALERVDALVVPVTRCVAPAIEADPLDLRDLLTPFTRPFSVTGHPVVALPVKSPGLPVGVQIVGPRGGEDALLAVAAALETAWG